jgi:hypothetical protein
MPFTAAVPNLRVTAKIFRNEANPLLRKIAARLADVDRGRCRRRHAAETLRRLNSLAEGACAVASGRGPVNIGGR